MLFRSDFVLVKGQKLCASCQSTTVIQRMHMVLSDSGERNCVGVLHDILTAASGSQLYGQVMTNENS